MSLLRVSLFGQMAIVHDKQSPKVKISPTLQELFAYLLLNDQPQFHSRNVLIDVCWGNCHEKQARNNLSTALWRLRRLLEPAEVTKGTYLLTSTNGDIGFNWQSDFWLDVVAFESQISQFLKKSSETIPREELPKLEATLQLYSADLLEGVYEDWVLRERERLRQLYLKGLTFLMTCFKHHKLFEQSLTYGQKILDHDPLRENIHREIMRLYWETGQRTLAVRQYQQCQQQLATELNISPMKETQALYNQIIQTTAGEAPTANKVNGNLINLQQATHQLQLAQQEFRKAQEKLHHALQLVEQVMQQHV